MKVFIYTTLCCLLFTLTGYKYFKQQKPAGNSNSIYPYTFVVMGDDRVNKGDVNGANTIDTNNFNRILKFIHDSINPRPEYLLMNGDLIYGYCKKNESGRLRSELNYWITEYNKSRLDDKGVKLITIPGNHEISGNDTENEEVFLQVMKNYIRPHIVKKKPTMQDSLYYSFDFGEDHFIILNTDFNKNEYNNIKIWLDSDLSKTKSNNHIFVFGHEPLHLISSIEIKYFGDTSHREPIQPYLESLWPIINHRCDIYFGSHVHIWDTMPRNGDKTREVICGNAGMQPNPKWPSPYYGFTLVTVYEHKVRIESWGYDVDIKEPYTYPFTSSFSIKDSFTVYNDNSR